MISNVFNCCIGCISNRYRQKYINVPVKPYITPTFFHCSNIQINPQTNLNRKASCPANWQLNWHLFFFWKAVFLASLYYLEHMWEKKNHSVVAWLGFGTALCWWCNDQSSARRFYDTTSELEVGFRLWFWSPAVFVLFLHTRKENVLRSVTAVFSCPTPLLSVSSPFYLDSTVNNFLLLCCCYILQLLPSLWKTSC